MSLLDLVLFHLKVWAFKRKLKVSTLVVISHSASRYKKTCTHQRKVSTRKAKTTIETMNRKFVWLTHRSNQRRSSRDSVMYASPASQSMTADEPFSSPVVRASESRDNDPDVSQLPDISLVSPATTAAAAECDPDASIVNANQALEIARMLDQASIIDPAPNFFAAAPDHFAPAAEGQTDIGVLESKLDNDAASSAAPVIASKSSDWGQWIKVWVIACLVMSGIVVTGCAVLLFLGYQYKYYPHLIYTVCFINALQSMEL